VLLTISTTHRPATDLGFLLHKNPGRHHVAELGFGTAHVVYPEAAEERCSAAVLVDVDPVRLVRGRPGDPDRSDLENDASEESAERQVASAGQRVPLHAQRLAAVLGVIAAVGARSVLDLGCGSGKLLAELVRQPGLRRIVGVDVSHRALEAAGRRLHLDHMAPRQRERVELLHGSLTYRDSRLRGFDAAAVVEVIEHLDPPRVGAFENALFGHARPDTVVLTTPNAEYNVLLPGLEAGSFRHADHRFEWTRGQFAEWAAGVADRYGYRAELSGVGPEGTGPDGAELGCPSQLAVFRR
jgi:3' terminal RNA ribose 2'-O-methyltransferase Hen1